MDEDDISVSGHSVGIVENPLFADDGTGGSGPTYAALRAKEKKKEAEVRTNKLCYWRNRWLLVFVTQFYTALHSAQAELDSAEIGQGLKFAINYNPPEDF